MYPLHRPTGRRGRLRIACGSSHIIVCQARLDGLLSKNHDSSVPLDPSLSAVHDIYSLLRRGDFSYLLSRTWWKMLQHLMYGTSQSFRPPFPTICTTLGFQLIDSGRLAMRRWSTRRGL